MVDRKLIGAHRELDWEDFETVGIILLVFLISLLAFGVSLYLMTLGFPFLVMVGVDRSIRTMVDNSGVVSSAQSS